VDGGAHAGKWYPGSLSVGERRAAVERAGIELQHRPEPFGSYVEAVQAGTLLFLSGMLPTEGHIGVNSSASVGAELDVEQGAKRSPRGAEGPLAVARQHLGSLDKVTRIVRLGVSVATSEMSPISRKVC